MSATWTQAPHWLEVRVIEGLQTLLTLRLRNAPPADTIEAVVEVWLAVFMSRNVQWQEERDAPRIHSAFLTIAGTVDFWPAPVQVFQAMPHPPEPLKLAAPRPGPISPEIKAKLAELVKSMRVPKPITARTSPRAGQQSERSTPEELRQAEEELRQHHAAIKTRQNGGQP